jgi:hypothetical protein
MQMLKEYENKWKSNLLGNLHQDCVLPLILGIIAAECEEGR